LLDLKPKEELQFIHHRHLKYLGHDPTKFFTKFVISGPKDNIININLTNKDIFSISLNEESRIGFAYLKTVLEKKILNTFIPCSRSLLKTVEPYGACTHGWEILNLQSPVVAQHKLLLREVHSRMHSSHPFDEA
jgi:hypothetical protein